MCYSAGSLPKEIFRPLSSQYSSHWSLCCCTFTVATLQASSALLTYIAFPFLQSRLQIYQIGSLLTPSVRIQTISLGYWELLAPLFLTSSPLPDCSERSWLPPTTLWHASLLKLALPGYSPLQPQPQEGLPVLSVPHLFPLSQRPAEPLHPGCHRHSHPVITALPPLPTPKSHPCQ